MRYHVRLTDEQRMAMLPYKRQVGELYRTLDWLRDSILNENRQEFDLAVKGLRDQLAALEALIAHLRTAS